jgi:large conductance mechanosensitive channel
MWKEFRDFINRGSVIDLAVGVIIGGAFGKIVTSLVNDVLMPLISLGLAGRNFAGQFIPLNGQTYASLDQAREAGAAVLAWGNFVQSVIDFLIIAFVIFVLVRTINRMQRKPEPAPAAPPPPSKEEQLLTEIRDLLKTQRS